MLFPFYTSQQPESIELWWMHKKEGATSGHALPRDHQAPVLNTNTEARPNGRASGQYRSELLKLGGFRKNVSAETQYSVFN